MSVSFWDTIENISNASEANVETWLVLPLLEALGHERACIDAKVPVDFQEGRQKRPGRKPEADFVVYAEKPFSRANSLIVVETKRSDEPLDEGKSQGESYAHNLRTPILMMTNGLRFELWQMQVTSESICVLECKVSELAVRRSDLEAILSKDAIKSHCANITHKRFDLLARDLFSYEIAQYEEVLPKSKLKIARVLVDQASKRSVRSIDLLTSGGRGAVVVGPSGYGKTILAAALLHEGLEKRWEDTASALPIGIFLPDVVFAERAFDEFLADRIASHKAGFTLAMLCSAAREQGLLVIADGFDRVAPEHRSRLEGTLRTFLTDFPRARLFVMSRAQAAPSGLPLPIFELNKFAVEELRELARARSLSHPVVQHVFTGAPDYVYRISEIPILADLLLDRYARDQKYTSNIASLYEEWLSHILAALRPLDRALDRELLTQVAIATSSGPINLRKAMELCQHHSSPERTLNSLVEADALSIRGTTVELQHEGLADYLRSLHYWNTHPQASGAELAKLAFDTSSQFPILLVATAPNADARGNVWQAISRTDMQLSIRALRFAASDETFGDETESDTKRLLTDIRTTIETFVTAHLEPIGDLIRNEIAGADVRCLGIHGVMGADDISYSFFEAEGETEVVRLIAGQRQWRASRMYGHALRRVGYGPESGRIIGTDKVREALLALVKSRRLRGGRVWIEERVFGRLRHLAKEYDAPVSSTALQDAHDFLKPDAHTQVAASDLGGGQGFPMQELLNDITWLIGSGVPAIHPWWDDLDNLELRSSEGRHFFARTVSEYHRKRQLAYAEVVQHSFPALAPHFPTLRIMPLRMEIEVSLHTEDGFEYPAMDYRRWPVGTFDDAGADVNFPHERSDWDSEGASQGYVEKTDALLRRFGRWFIGRSVEWGSTIRPLDFHGRDTAFDGLPDESVVVRGAMDWLKKDLEKLFSEIPTFRFLPRD